MIKSSQQPSQVLGYLFLGSKEAAKSKDSLKINKIKYILNCTPARNDDPEAGVPNYYEKEKSMGLIYKRIPIFDNKGEDLVPYFEQAYRFIEEGRHYGNVLVHCHKGISRSSSFVIAYLMRKDAFTYSEALSYVQSIRSIVHPNEAFERQLIEYEGQLLRVDSASNTANANCSSIIGPAPSTVIQYNENESRNQTEESTLISKKRERDDNEERELISDKLESSPHGAVVKKARIVDASNVIDLGIDYTSDSDLD